ncbi:hypothetical protein BDZ85DRAFT_267082 [Elsinoe ampelina]|uniref:EXPERA domain-containing protein n=1 Tax=Elsinoe ampelina TaxID=302913 RepID=A0A6A6G559_9PEZI|nr:hypothetical protein BDZ85DRAFT_267082 [Elsinoe ampelina]
MPFTHGSSPLLSHGNRLALLLYLPICALLHLAMLPFRTVFTIQSWSSLGTPYGYTSRYDRNTARGRPYQITTLVIETLLLPVVLFELWTLWRRRLTYAAFLAYAVGWTVYWGACLGVTVGLMVDVSEALGYYLIYYMIVVATIMGLYVCQMFWAVGVFFAARKERRRAETIPGGAQGARGSCDVYLEDMSGEVRGKKSTSMDV